MSDVRAQELRRRALQGDPEARRRWAIELCRMGAEHLVDDVTQAHLNRAAGLMAADDSNVERLRYQCLACGKVVRDMRQPGQETLDGREHALWDQAHRAPGEEPEWWEGEGAQVRPATKRVRHVGCPACNRTGSRHDHATEELWDSVDQRDAAGGP